jgi:hypothetical protein
MSLSAGGGGSLAEGSIGTDPVRNMVATMMSTGSNHRPYYRDPGSAEAAVPPPSKQPNALFGTILHGGEQARLKQLSEMEIERGAVRFGLSEDPLGNTQFSLQTPEKKAQLQQRHQNRVHYKEGVKDPLSVEKPLEFEHLKGDKDKDKEHRSAFLVPELVKPPRAIKTREGGARRSMESRNQARTDGATASSYGMEVLLDPLTNQELPAAPYGSYEAQSAVQSSGVPAGAGLMLWRPRYRVSNEGRYRAGQALTRLRNDIKKGPENRPFIPCV